MEPSETLTNQSQEGKILQIQSKNDWKGWSETVQVFHSYFQ